MNCNSFVIARPVRSSQLDQCLAEKSITCILKPTLIYIFTHIQTEYSAAEQDSIESENAIRRKGSEG
jgi:hypothetical protein